MKVKVFYACVTSARSRIHATASDFRKEGGQVATLCGRKAVALTEGDAPLLEPVTFTGCAPFGTQPDRRCTYCLKKTKREKTNG